jgi:hypothetical protein
MILRSGVPVGAAREEYADTVKSEEAEMPPTK